jgi:hypothetical protein
MQKEILFVILWDTCILWYKIYWYYREMLVACHLVCEVRNLLLVCGQRITTRMRVTRDTSCVNVQTGLNTDKMQLFLQSYWLMRAISLPIIVNCVGIEQTTVRRNFMLGIWHTLLTTIVIWRVKYSILSHKALLCFYILIKL